jgi:cytochrome P450
MHRPDVRPLSPFGPWPQRDPWPDWLQDGQHCPVRVTLDDGYPAVAVTSYRDVRRIARSPIFSRAAAVDPGREDVTGIQVYMSGTLAGEDPPAHTRLRKLIKLALTPQMVARMRPRITQIVAECLDDLLAKGSPGDLVSGLCMPMPVKVLCELLGIPADDVPLTLKWAEVVAGTPERTVLDSTFGEMYMTSLGWIEARREAPRDDVITAMTRAARETDVDDRELTSVLLALLIGGIESTPVILGLLITTLFEFGEFTRLREEPGLIPLAVAEALRWLRFTPGTVLPRVALSDVTLGGVVIEKGERVVPLWPAANRDPSVFPDPDRFDILRKTASETPPLAFGAGSHRCPGAVLAPVELEITIRAMAERMPGLRLDEPADQLTFADGAAIHSLTRLQVRW